MVVGAKRHGLARHRCARSRHSVHAPRIPSSIRTSAYVYIDTYISIYTRIYVYARYIYRNTRVIFARAPKYLITQQDRPPPPTRARGRAVTRHRRQRQPGAGRGSHAPQAAIFPAFPQRKCRAPTPAPAPHQGVTDAAGGGRGGGAVTYPRAAPRAEPGRRRGGKGRVLGGGG